jgi:hypothetical protein
MAEIEGIEQVNRALNEVPARLIQRVARIIDRNSLVMLTNIRTEHLVGGTTDTRLRRRSGVLANSLRVVKAEIKGESIEGGVSIGTKYARPHFGPLGQITVIKGKKGWLTIPIDKEHGGVLDEDYEGAFPSTTKTGVGRGSAMFGPWTNTFVKKSSRGNLIIWGQMKSYSKVKVGGVAVKGLVIRKVSDKIVPLFLLRKQVKIPARVDPNQILNFIAPKLKEDLVAGGLKVTGE